MARPEASSQIDDSPELEAAQQTLVRVLTLKLEQLRAEKDQLERVLEEPLSQALRQQLHQHLASQRQSTSRKSHGALSSSTSPSTDSTSTSTSSSQSSLPSSPPLHLHALSCSAPPAERSGGLSSVDLAAVAGPSSVFDQLRAENDDLRNRLASSEAAHERAQSILRRLGFPSPGSLEDLAEFSLDTGVASTAPSASIGIRRRERSSSRSTGAWSTVSSTGSSYVGSINHAAGVHIPGSSVSPSATGTSVFPNRNGRAHSAAASYLAGPYSSSRASFSSINTTLTTPSSSFPINVPPQPSPASSGGAGRGSATVPPAFFSPPSRQQSTFSNWPAVTTQSAMTPLGSPHGYARIHWEDLLPATSTDHTTSDSNHSDIGENEGMRTPLRAGALGA